MINKNQVWWAFGILLLAVLLPTLIPEFYVFLLTEIMIFGLFGMAVNLLVGYTGMITFGHAAFYGIGAYSLGLLLKKAGLSFPLAMLLYPFITVAFGFGDRLVMCKTSSILLCHADPCYCPVHLGRHREVA